MDIWSRFVKLNVPESCCECILKYCVVLVPYAPAFAWDFQCCFDRAVGWERIAKLSHKANAPDVFKLRPLRLIRVLIWRFRRSWYQSRNALGVVRVRLFWLKFLKLKMSFWFKVKFGGLFVLSPIGLVLGSRVNGGFGLRGYRRTIMHCASCHSLI